MKTQIRDTLTYRSEQITTTMSYPIVQIEEGRVRGKVNEDVRGGRYFSFEGIPYGEAPVGNLRFKAPVPVKPWSGLKDAFKQGPPNFGLQFDITKLKDIPADPQLRMAHIGKITTLSGSEDCLNLNVFTPTLPRTGINLRPVMVYIHGGAFTLGNTFMFGPGYLIAEDVVIVHLHYRLGALGFLAMDDPDADVPGNAAMKDMVLALKWVQRNIRNFNGDPDNVTIFGESAGGAAAHYLAISPATKGLIHKAIIQSGSTFNTWAYGDNHNATSLAKVLGCTETEDVKILKFLQGLPVDVLFKGQLMLKDYIDSSDIRNFSPVIEKYSTESAFLLKDPMDIISSGNYNHIPLMSGYTSLEGMMFAKLAPVLPIQSHGIDRDHLPPHFLKLEKGSAKYKEIAERIEKFYFGTKTPEPVSQAGCLMVSDMCFIRGIIAHSKIHAKTSEKPVYLYKMSVKSKTSLFPIEEEIARVAKGVPHGGDVGYLFMFPAAPQMKPGSLEDIAQRRFCKLWTNFAKYSNPNSPQEDNLLPVEWKPLKKDVTNFLDIGEDLVAGVDPEGDRMAFWDGIFKQFPHAVNY